MPAKRLCAAFVIAVTILAINASAQKNEIAGGLGPIFIVDQNIRPGPVPLFNNTVHFSNGLTYEINYARRVIDRGLLALDFEVPVIGNPEEDLASGNGAVPASYSAYFVTPAARLKVFADTHFQPWVSFGGGYGRFHMSKTEVFGGANPGPTSKSSGLFQGGVGLDVKTFSKLSLRLAVRDFISGVLPLNVNTGQSHQHNIVVTGGIVWRF